LRLVDGRILAPLESDQDVVAQKLQLQASLNNGSVDYSLTLQASTPGGVVKASGFFNLPVHNQPILSSLVSRTDLVVEHLQIEGLLGAAHQFSSAKQIPAGQGLVDGQWLINTSGLTEFMVNGEMTVDQLSLQGGFLGEDQPSVNHLRVEAKGRKSADKGIELDRIDVASEIVSFSGKGTFHADQTVAEAKGKLDALRRVSPCPELKARRICDRGTAPVCSRPQTGGDGKNAPDKLFHRCLTGYIGPATRCRGQSH